MAAEQMLQTITNSERQVEARKSFRTLLKHLNEAVETKKGAFEDVTFFRLRLTMNRSQNQGFILDGYPETSSEAKDLLTAGGSLFAGEDAGEDEGQRILDSQVAPDLVFIFEAPDSFLKKRLTSSPLLCASESSANHQGKEFQTELDAYRSRWQHYKSSVQAFLDEHKIAYYPIDITLFTSNDRLVQYLAGLMGKPRNYGGVQELEKDQVDQQHKLEKKIKALALLESREVEERRKQIQKWVILHATNNSLSSFETACHFRSRNSPKSRRRNWHVKRLHCCHSAITY